MFCLQLLYIYILITGVYGHVINKSGDETTLRKDISLLDLVKASKLPAQWNALESARLVEGRVVLTPKTNTKGSIWLQDPFPIKDAFTVEWTFRSINFSGKSKGGMSFWVLDDTTQLDDKLYGGPNKFSGLQILIDNFSNYGPSVRGILNDGSQEFKQEDIYSNAFASCLMGYQDSALPFTMRLSYSPKENHLLKLQIDNQVCFQTRKILLPQKNFRIGTSANNAGTEESFELLRIKLYDDILEKALEPNMKAMPQPKTVQKIINKDTGAQTMKEKDIFDTKKSDVSVLDIYKKIDQLEGKIIGNDVSTLLTSVDNAIEGQRKMNKHLDELLTQLKLFAHFENKDLLTKDDTIIPDNYKEFLNMNDKLGELLKEQESIRMEHRKNHGEITSTDVLNKLFLWMLPLIGVILLTAYHTYKIQQEISKTKLL